MKSDLPKVMFPVLGRPMIHWVLDALESAGVTRSIVVVGYRSELVREELSVRTGIEFVLQEQQLGTGHAVQMCRTKLQSHNGQVLVVTGDSPLIQTSSIRKLLSEFESENYACLLGTLLKDDPTGLGRIVRDEQGQFLKIVEEKDATAKQKQVREVNMSTYAFGAQDLLAALSKLGNSNAQGEYYLTDCPALLRSEGRKVDARPLLQACESLSINTVDELGAVEAKMKQMGYS